MPPFHGVLGEDDSDAEAVATLIRRLREAHSLPRIKVKQHGYEGCAELLRKGHAQLRAWEKAGCTCVVVCYDADKNDPSAIRQEVERSIIRASGVTIPCRAVVPVEASTTQPPGIDPKPQGMAPDGQQAPEDPQIPLPSANAQSVSR
jgi:hypothetical protein